MAQVYASLIRRALWALEQVPERWRADVAALLENE